MPRHRVILLLWLTGTVLLLGAWGNSLHWDSSIALASRPGSRGLRASVYLGTFAIQVGESAVTSPPGVQFESFDSMPKSVPGDRNALQKVDYFVGPFGEFDWDTEGKSWSLAVPLWFLLLLFAALCLPCYLRARKNVFRLSSADR